ncbi:MAG: endonuclease III domain-containing protein [Planctomycetes bacterium]|nr:endonuclease III domain-containing protein [Planctomycetota bacterium]
MARAGHGWTEWIPLIDRATPTPAESAPTIRRIYKLLYAHYGPQDWWPADSPFEVVVGAILTQNTAWSNVVKAIAALKQARRLTVAGIRVLGDDELADLIRPAGTYRVKARRLRAVVDWLWEESRGDVGKALSGDLETVRGRLLAIHGVGPETADSILLYAGGHSSFVIDAYTRRILRRHRVIDGGESYEKLRTMMMGSVRRDLETYREYHALLVQVAKQHCRVRAHCDGCPLESLPHDEAP